MDGSHNLCQTSTGQEDDWKLLYERAFPSDERMPVDDLRKLISNGTVVLHKTTNKTGELLCFSVVNLMSNFSLLAYIASDETKRSSGVGSKHMKKLIELLKASHPTHIGLFLEIESTKESGLDPDTQKTRNRRLAFYQRLGCKRLHKTYLMPSYTAGGTPRQGELLWAEFLTSCVTEASLPKVIEEIFAKGYNLTASDSLVQQVLAQFNGSDGKPTTSTACAVVETQAAAPAASGATDGSASGGASTVTEPAATTASATEPAANPATVSESAASTASVTKPADSTTPDPQPNAAPQPASGHSKPAAEADAGKK